jgi:tRNA (cytidine/uridine-2'-O-)-methyltransferase
MFHIVLFEPEIPPNTGNIIRLCANTDSRLHLIEPLGFRLDDRLLRRAGLDYREWAEVQVHPSFDSFLTLEQPQRCIAMTTRGELDYHQFEFQPGDTLIFGPESRGLPAPIRQSAQIHYRLRIPMLPESRSINLSNAVALTLYEALRQTGFAGLG